MNTNFVEVTTTQHSVVMSPGTHLTSTTYFQQVIDSFVLFQPNTSEVGHTLHSYHLTDSDL